MTHAFEALKTDAVYFKIHVKNICSQQAVLRLGANLIGVIKNYQTMPGKEKQNYNHYSITASNWPDVKHSLLTRLCC